MDNILKMLWDIKATCCLKEKEEICEREKVNGQLVRVSSSHPVSFTVLHSILSQEVVRRSAAHTTFMSLQVGLKQELFYQPIKINFL